jgi:5-methylcytosine-specific restriction endonuclease McrA
MLDAVTNDRKLKNQIVGALRRVWHLSPLRKEVLEKVRVEKQEYKKDGSPRAKLSIYYICEQCGTEAKQGRPKHHPRIHVDHIDPVIPIEVNDSFTWDDLIKRMFTTKDNLQALCDNCHSVKTQRENKERREQARENT